MNTDIATPEYVWEQLEKKIPDATKLFVERIKKGMPTHLVLAQCIINNLPEDITDLFMSACEWKAEQILKTDKHLKSF